MKRVAGLLCVFWLCFITIAHAQPAFDHLTVAGGLSQSSVLSICQDSRGYMWFGTRDRLNRYDAHSIKIFNHDYRDSSSISCSDYVFAITEDRSKNLWIGTVRGLNLYLPESNGFAHFLHNAQDNNSISDNNVYCIYQDRAGRLWFGTNNGLNMLPTPASRKFIHYYKNPQGNGLIDNQVYSVYHDRLNNIWIGGATGLTCLTFYKGEPRFRHFSSTGSQPDSLQGNAVRTIAEDRQGNLWIGTETGGLNLYHPATSTFSHFKHDAFSGNSLSSNDVRKIFRDKKGQLWVGTINGLNIFDPQSRTFTHYEHDAENRNSLSDNSIKDIYQDHNGSIWVGTTYGGVNVSHPDNIPFRIYQNNQFRNSISGNIVSAIVAGNGSNLWIGTEGYGLNCFDRATGLFKQYKNVAADKQSLSSNFVKAIYRDHDNNLWIGLHQGGLELMQGSGSFKHYRHDPHNPASISSDIVSSLLEDTRGRFWVGTAQGLNLFDKQTQRFRDYFTDPLKPFKLTKNSVRCIYEDTHHNIWVGTTTGLNLLTANAHQFKWFLPNERNPDSLRVSYINCVKEDDSGNLWVGSFHGGLSLYRPATQSFKTYGLADGLPSDNVLNIQQGDARSLWLSTDNGLALFDLITHKVRTFTVKDGLPTNEFNYNSSFKDASGALYFGTYNGLISFSPRQITRNTIEPAIQFTSLKLFNQPVKIGDESGLLSKDISLTDEITFHHDQNVFSIDFTALNFDKRDRNRFMYRLDGFETAWNIVSAPTATYTNLPAGDYDLQVRAGNNDGVWSRHIKSLHIKVLPPFWKTWWAYVLYAIAFISTLYLVIRFFRRQARLERDLYYEHLQHERQQELYQLKLDFFTKISHEIRTPLSLIIAPVEKLLGITPANQTISKALGHVKQNADRLMRLVDELLDFRKIESGHMKIYAAGQDAVAFCRSIYLSFEPLAASRGIDYSFTGPDEPFLLYFDAPQLEKVLFNILANAFKFTPDGGAITLVLTDEPNTVTLQVIDNGKGIAPDAVPHIFENFYQDKQSSQGFGWGIGLALVKNIVDLHKGSISVNSQQATADQSGKTTFTINLLKGHAHFRPDELTQHNVAMQQTVIDADLLPVADAATEQLIGDNQDKPVLLLVEDNTELRNFVKEALSDIYNVHDSADGQEGYEAAVKLIPDVVISDVAMPVMDGFELCSRLKSDERTNHIPIILLTARAAQGQLISGLQQGADVYLTKPFSMQVLELNVRNLLLTRQAMRQKFSQQVTLMPRNKVIESPDEVFLNKLMTIIEQHMENTEFDVLRLVKEIGMSQPVLYRKIKALTDMTIADFIKSVRLKQAAAMLSQQKLSIAEVAYAVGFNDRKYFSKEFKKQFGLNPTDYAGHAENSGV